MATLNPGLIESFPEVDATALKEIVETDLSDDRLNNFLNLAYAITRPLAGKLAACGGAGAEKSILLFLAAHFYRAMDQAVASESIGDYSVSYQTIMDKGLYSTLYGQNALALDCSGHLATLGMKRASMRVTSYYDISVGIDSDFIHDL